MLDWLRVYNVEDEEPFIEAVDKAREQYFDDKLDILKDAVSILGISQGWRRKLNAETCTKKNCKDCKEVQQEFKEYPKIHSYKLLPKGMVGEPAIVFTRYHKCGKIPIRGHLYDKDRKKCKTILGYNANAFYSTSALV